MHRFATSAKISSGKSQMGMTAGCCSLLLPVAMYGWTKSDDKIRLNLCYTLRWDWLPAIMTLASMLIIGRLLSA
jgi:hypothetical protein